jgi:hypothetical protein
VCYCKNSAIANFSPSVQKVPLGVIGDEEMLLHLKEATPSACQMYRSALSESSQYKSSNTKTVIPLPFDSE